MLSPSLSEFLGVPLPSSAVIITFPCNTLFQTGIIFYEHFNCLYYAQVSWIRHRDIHILTVGGYTYTTDQRFQAIHKKDSEEWVLQIKWAQKRDGGMYECQISTQPVRSFFVNLSVVGTCLFSFQIIYKGPI